MNLHQSAILCLLSLSCTLPTRACLWDKDTIRDEERGLPGMEELLAGKFKRHFKLYYERRIQQLPKLSPWPVACPRGWLDTVNTPLTAKEQDRLATSLRRGRPYGDEPWTRKIVKSLGLEHTARREGRPGRDQQEQ